jgi:hypothetical protein
MMAKRPHPEAVSAEVCEANKRTNTGAGASPPSPAQATAVQATASIATAAGANPTVDAVDRLQQHLDQSASVEAELAAAVDALVLGLERAATRELATRGRARAMVGRALGGGGAAGPGCPADVLDQIAEEVGPVTPRRPRVGGQKLRSTKLPGTRMGRMRWRWHTSHPNERPGAPRSRNRCSRWPARWARATSGGCGGWFTTSATQPMRTCAGSGPANPRAGLRCTTRDH